LGQSELNQRVEMVRRALEYRQSPGALPIVDIYNVDLVCDAKETIRDAYERLGIVYSDAFDQALARRNAERPKGKFGVHGYAAADYGLDEADISRRFAFYTSALQVPLGR
jgi:hypothetical protein